MNSGGFRNLSLVDDTQLDFDSGGRMPEKDPRKGAKKYQLELCNKALEENIIVYLGTGCGKTHIAVLLIHAMGHLIREPQRNICVFLAPTVVLVEQQARVIENSTNFKTGVYRGNSKRLKSPRVWEEEIKKYEVLVMTPQILLHNLHHCFMKMEFISLLIFDECHHAQVNSSHPYSQIMKVFYIPNATKLPRVFGMTASPVIGKVASNQGNLSKSINSLESLLHAKVYTVEDRDDLEAFVSSPLVKIYHYGPVENNLSSSFMTCCDKLEDIKRQYISMLGGKTAAHQTLLSTKKLLCRVHDNIKFCMGSLGLWGASQASQILLSGDHSEWSELIDAEENQNDVSICDKYLAQAAQLFASECGRDLSCVDILKEPFFSKKLLRLVGILTTFRFRPNMKCIVFVNRTVTARSLSFILQNLKTLVYWKCHFLIGVHAGVKSMSRKTMNVIIEKFRSGELNLLVATRVGEEGLDIQTCCLVIRFDIPETVASFIQSRGRARMPESEYAFLVDSGNQRELDLIKNFGVDEDRIDKEVSSRSSSETLIGSEESIYKVESSGALITSGYSVSLLHQYCSKLPHDEYFQPKPKFFYFDDLGGIVCHIILPSNAPMHQVVGTPQSSMEAAKKDACLKAIQELHKLGALNDFLLPLKDDANAEELDVASTDFDSCEDDEFGFVGIQIYDSREELHEMIVPGALKDPWTDLNNVLLNVYHIKLIPEPKDRIYKEFGLFVKMPLPKEAETMEVDLHLSRGRSVMAKFITLGPVKLNKDEIKLAEEFQEMSLKVILDRSEFIPEFVPLGRNNASESSSSTFYLLLPMIFCEKNCSELIDWEIIRRCLSSPVFSDRKGSLNTESFPSRNQLQLADGCISISDVKNSLVYAPHKKEFFFIADIVYDKNGYSPYTNSDPKNHVEHLIKKFGIYLKYPGQPLLRAKQLFRCRNLLHNRKLEDSEAQHLEEYFIDLPPELCKIKIIGFSKEVGSSLSLLPSIMHRLENMLVAVELKHLFSGSFPEGAEVTANRILEALTTEKCQERFSLERLEILGDAFLKFAVGRHLFLLHDALGEGELTKKRSDIVNNSNLLKLATSRNLQVYIRDQLFEPSKFYAFGRPCPFVCDKKTIEALHNKGSRSTAVQGNLCSKRHHWLHNGTISDVVEALVGAFLVDSGFKAAIAFLRWIGIQMKFESLKVRKICSDSKSYISLSDVVDIASLERSLDYKFLYRGLVLQAFVHPSYNKHGGGCYQRLEFLGDAVLDYLITSYLYSAYPKLKPGQLTDLRSVFVNNEAFANVAVHWSFHNFLICDSNELREVIKSYVESTETPTGGTVPLGRPKFPKVLGDLVESCVGAVLLDTGFNLNLVWKTMLLFLGQILRLSSFQLSPLREIQELCGSFNWACLWKASKKEKMFFISVEVTGDEVNATASASNQSKKEAIKIASQSILSQLRLQGYISKAARSLEEVLKSSCKSEAKLIGYDEIPVDVTAPETTVAEPLDINLEPKIQLLREVCSPPSPVNRQPSPDNGASSSCKRTARSLLYEVCAAQYWAPPLFDCFIEEGPSHLRSFNFRVVVQMDEAPDTILEAFGGPHLSKKAAAEHAAEGMLWYLTNSGHLPNPPASL